MINHCVNSHTHGHVIGLQYLCYAPYDEDSLPLVTLPSTPGSSLGLTRFVPEYLDPLPPPPGPGPHPYLDCLELRLADGTSYALRLPLELNEAPFGYAPSSHDPDYQDDCMNLLDMLYYEDENVLGDVFENALRYVNDVEDTLEFLVSIGLLGQAFIKPCMRRVCRGIRWFYARYFRVVGGSTYYGTDDSSNLPFYFVYYQTNQFYLNNA